MDDKQMQKLFEDIAEKDMPKTKITAELNNGKSVQVEIAGTKMNLLMMFSSIVADLTDTIGQTEVMAAFFIGLSKSKEKPPSAGTESGT